MIGARYGLVLACFLPGTAAAQRGDALSLVGAVVVVGPEGRDFSDTDGGIGYELQVRFAASGSRSSVGAGFSSTVHPISMVVVRRTFVDLRVGVGADSASIGPYVTARLYRVPGPGASVGAGAGAVLVVNRWVQLDGSATVAHAWRRASDSWPAVRGTTLTLRAGAALRIG